ncbi:MAG TPA: HAMP domain-containing sensor histidine kinase [Abditibacteriaceae bacterium]|jgi:signal transduction histidine kinase
MSFQTTTREQLGALVDHLYARRPALLESWRVVVDNDPELTSGTALSRTLFNDHIPDILDSFGRRLHAWPDKISTAAQEQENKGMVSHGLHRWQQGFRLRELTREWGYLQLCLVDEVENYAKAHPEIEPTVIATVLRELTHLCVTGISDSVEQYWQLQQAEAAGHLKELEQALGAVNEIEKVRAAGWREAAHDLRGSVGVVKLATSMLQDREVPETMRHQVSTVLERSVSSLHDMLNGLIDLARLQAGHEQRTLAPFDAAVLLGDLCLATQPVAEAEGLFLKNEGLQSLPVVGDRAKVQRIVQNLVLNALKYTQKGGVIVSWGISEESDAERWMVSVQDTGSGFVGNFGVSMSGRLREATQGAHDVEEEATARGTSSNSDEPATTLASQSPLHQQAGEGIGLSIVKNLCDLLDATLELESSSGQGTTFRVTFPRVYQQI